MSAPRIAAPIVVKLGGRTQADPALPAALAALHASSGGRLILVHGGGDGISALQRLRGEEPVFVGGRRVTTPGALELVRMTLSGVANKVLVAALNSAGVRAVGISGEDGPTILAAPIDVATFGLSGTPTSVDTRLLSTLLDAGFLPVLSPVARDVRNDHVRGDDPPSAGAHSGDVRGGDAARADVPAHTEGALNVNGDDAAAAVAAALGASELFFLADVPGVLDDAKQRIPSLAVGAARFLVTAGIAVGGMAAKLDAGAAALAGGVARVRIGDLDALTATDAGTRITP